MERETGPHGQDVPDGGGRFFMPRDSFVFLGMVMRRGIVRPGMAAKSLAKKERADDERGQRYLLHGLPSPCACRDLSLRTRF